MRPIWGWLLVVFLVSFLFILNKIAPFTNVLENMANFVEVVADTDNVNAEVEPASGSSCSVPMKSKGATDDCFPLEPPPTDYGPINACAHAPRPPPPPPPEACYSTPKISCSPPPPQNPIEVPPPLEHGTMGPDIDPGFDSTKEELYCPPKSTCDPYVEPPPEKRPAPYGYVYLSDQYWKIPRTYSQEYAQNPSCPIYAMPTAGMPLDAVEYKRGVGTIMPDFAFKTL